MSGTYPYMNDGPATFAVNAAVTGGMLVEPDSTTGKIKPCTAGSGKCIGVALTDASPSGSGSNTDFSTNRPTVAVQRGADCRVTYAATAAFGAKLKAAASGQVTPWITGTDAADLMVGQCMEPAGVASGAVARAWIF